MGRALKWRQISLIFSVQQGNKKVLPFLGNCESPLTPEESVADRSPEHPRFEPKASFIAQGHNRDSCRFFFLCVSVLQPTPHYEAVSLIWLTPTHSGSRLAVENYFPPPHSHHHPLYLGRRSYSEDWLILALCSHTFLRKRIFKRMPPATPASPQRKRLKKNLTFPVTHMSMWPHTISLLDNRGVKQEKKIPIISHRVDSMKYTTQCNGLLRLKSFTSSAGCLNGPYRSFWWMKE